eukprot:13419345-Ditylum_brightwellii.AAC.1
MQEEIAELKKKLDNEKKYSDQMYLLLDKMETSNKRKASTCGIELGRHTTTNNEFKSALAKHIH